MADGKCPPCKPGAPAWMATFSDMCTLLLTFFILLLSFSKTETATQDAAMGSLRNAFGGNVLKAGDVPRLGKSPNDAATMIDSDQAPRPFPIEFLTSEGLLEKYEVNKESDEQLVQMRKLLKDYDFATSVDIYEMPEAILVSIKDRIYFKVGSTSIEGINIEVFEKVIRLLRENPWHIMVIGHSSAKEESADQKLDALELSSARAMSLARSFFQRGVPSSRVTTIFYGDSRPQPRNDGENLNDARVEFLIRKIDLRQEGKKVRAE